MTATGILASFRGLRREWAAIPPELVRAQIKASAQGYPIVFVAIVVVSLVLLATLRLNAHPGWTIAAFGLHMAVTFGVLYRWRRDQARDWAVDDSAAAITGYVGEAFFISLGWFTYLAVAAWSSRDEERILLAAITTGVLAVGALRFAPVPVASMTFIGTAIAVLAVLTATNPTLPAGLMLFLCVFAVLIGRAVLAQAALISEQHRSALALAAAAAERDLLLANSQREQWQRQATAAAEAARVQAADERGRREEMERVAEAFESAFLDTITQLGVIAGQTRGTADTLAETTCRTHAQIRGVVAHAGRADTGAAALLDESARLGQSLAAVEARLAEQETATKRMRELARLADDRFINLVNYTDGIDSVVETISAVAAHTRLLALNAGIEAVRAGEAGRGFSVVAQEVKALATQTSNATHSIRAQLSEITKAVTTTAGIVGDMRRSFEQIGEVTGAVEEAVTRQGDVIESLQQYAGVAAALTNDLQGSAVDADAASNTAATLTEQLGTATADLDRQTSALMRQTLDFLRNLRAA